MKGTKGSTKGFIGIVAVLAVLCLPATGSCFAPMSDAAQIAAAFMTNLAMHEVGHAAAGTMVGASGVNTSFFNTKNGSFFLGHTEYHNLKQEGRLPFLVGGPMMNSYTFDFALADYDRRPTTYNKALMFFSCTDFLYYSVYALYISKGNNHYDPLAIRQETGLSRETILGVALTQTILNGMRAFNMQDRVVPYFEVDRYWASFNLRVSF